MDLEKWLKTIRASGIDFITPCICCKYFANSTKTRIFNTALQDYSVDFEEQLEKLKDEVSTRLYSVALLYFWNIQEKFDVDRFLGIINTQHQEPRTYTCDAEALEVVKEVKKALGEIDEKSNFGSAYLLSSYCNLELSFLEMKPVVWRLKLSQTRWSFVPSMLVADKLSTWWIKTYQMMNWLTSMYLE